MVCSHCGIAIAPSAILGRHIHVPINTREVIAALKCPDYGKALPAEEEQDIPAIWRTSGHFNAMWDRS
jgi:uncharacterized protein YcsI (UPF0317 family)